ncbi:YrhA family protein [Hymenobacter norwichensis]|uniref:YrhA family protein n=1 Tax=Hymenobacter norwichensis TaxID=223903 RepID=UPI0003B75295|nr:YrhA family protein [Hymenobacter norwichensis]
MSATSQQLLANVLQDKAEASEAIQQPLAEAAQSEFKQQVRRMLTYELPAAYVAILAQSDGLDCNGVVLYASKPYYAEKKFVIQGFVEANVLLRDYLPNRDFVYFAESGMDFYRHNLQSQKFEISARVGGVVVKSFDTPEELFDQVLNHMLDNYDDED